MKKMWFWGLALTLLFVPSSWATDCGDTAEPGGMRVACQCGDTVTTNTVLRKTDPVVSTGPGDVCGGDGLTLGKDGLGSRVVLNCNKLTLRGTGVGVGVWLDAGFFLAVQDCTIRGFEEGIRDDAHGRTLIESNTIIRECASGHRPW